MLRPEERPPVQQNISDGAATKCSKTGKDYNPLAYVRSGPTIYKGITSLPQVQFRITVGALHHQSRCALKCFCKNSINTRTLADTCLRVGYTA